MVPFCLKSYNIVAPYENLDDDYASKMGKSTVAFIPEVTISESEIAELEKPKFKEVKPKVSKVDKAVEVTSKAGKITEGGRKYGIDVDNLNFSNTVSGHGNRP